MQLRRIVTFAMTLVVVAALGIPTADAAPMCLERQPHGQRGNDNLFGQDGNDDFADGGPGTEFCDSERTVNCEV